MAYCAICGRDHDPTSACAAGIQRGGADSKRKRRPSVSRQFEDNAKKADWLMITIAVVAVAVFAVLIHYWIM